MNAEEKQGMKKIKVSLISFSPLSLGLRTISSYLKSCGYETQILISPEYHVKISDGLLKNISSIVKDSSLIGLSIMCIDYLNAVNITQYLKKELNIPIIWGGSEVVANPEACIRYADIICIGEGEETILQLSEKLREQKSFLDVPNIWIKKEGKIIKNPPSELVTDLDKYPFPDYEIAGHYIYDKNLNIFRKMSNADLDEYVFYNKSVTYGNFKEYHTMTTRGCPHRCTYCSNNILRRRYKGRYVRRRSISNVIDELKWVKSKFGIDSIHFRDDNFTLRTEEEIIKFSKRYKKEVDLPFHTSSTPLTLNEKKLEALSNCGLTSIKIGVQTGSERTLKEVYKRPTNNKIVLKVANLIHKHKFERGSTYDFIFDNPFENIDDYVKTLKLISNLPRPCNCLYHSLVLLPGTEMYNMAKQAGYIHDEASQVYNKKHRVGGQFNYIRFFCAFYPMIPFRIPRFISNFLTKKKTVAFLQHKRFDKMFKYLTIVTFFFKYSIQIFIYRILRSKFSIKEIKNITILIYKYFLNPEKKF